MNRTFVAAVIVLAALPLGMPAAHAGSDEAEIRQRLEDWASAFRARDLDGIMAMYSPDVVAFDIAPPLRYVGADAYRKDYAEFIDAYVGPLEVEYRDLAVTVSGDLGVATCLERLGGTLKDGQHSEMWVRVTSVFRRIDGRWYDVHDHVSAPTDFATGMSVLDLKP